MITIMVTEELTLVNNEHVKHPRREVTILAPAWAMDCQILIYNLNNNLNLHSIISTAVDTPTPNMSARFNKKSAGGQWGHKR